MLEWSAYWPASANLNTEMAAADDKKLGEMLVGRMPTLFAFVRRRVGDRETINEILQEVSLRALAGEGPRDPENFLSWSCGIARHVIGMEWRRRRVRTQQPLEEPLIDQLRDPWPLLISASTPGRPWNGPSAMTPRA